MNARRRTLSVLFGGSDLRSLAITSLGLVATTRSSSAATGNIPGQNDFDQINVRAFPAAPTTRTAVSCSQRSAGRYGPRDRQTRASACSIPTRNSGHAPTRRTAATCGSFRPGWLEGRRKSCNLNTASATPSFSRITACGATCRCSIPRLTIRPKAVQQDPKTGYIIPAPRRYLQRVDHSWRRFHRRRERTISGSTDRNSRGCLRATSSTHRLTTTSCSLVSVWLTLLTRRR